MISSLLVIKRTMQASCQQIFEAWSQPELMQKWFFPEGGKVVVSNEFKVGGQYKLDMFGHDGTVHTHTGEYKEIVPNKKIVFTWNSPFVQNTVVILELQETNGKTEITLTHDLFPSEELRKMHQEGWQGCLDNLTQFLTQRSYQCTIHYQAPIEKVYQAIHSENGLKNWWSQDCVAKLDTSKTEYTLRFDGTFCVMQVQEKRLNEKVVWKCIAQYHDNDSLNIKDEWIGTTVVFNLNKNTKSGTDLQFIHEGLTEKMECYNICQRGWDYFLKESLKAYLEIGVGKPYDEHARLLICQ